MAQQMPTNALTVFASFLRTLHCFSIGYQKGLYMCTSASATPTLNKRKPVPRRPGPHAAHPETKPCSDSSTDTGKVSSARSVGRHGPRHLDHGPKRKASAMGVI